MQFFTRLFGKTFVTSVAAILTADLVVASVKKLSSLRIVKKERVKPEEPSAKTIATSVKKEKVELTTKE